MSLKTEFINYVKDALHIPLVGIAPPDDFAGLIPRAVINRDEFETMPGFFEGGDKLRNRIADDFLFIVT